MKKLLITLASVITMFLNAQDKNSPYGVATNTTSSNYNRQSLKPWDAIFSKIITTGTVNANVLVLADSWATQGFIWQPWSVFMRDKFGDAGTGYCGTNSLTTSSGFNQADNFAVTRTVTSGWANISQKQWILSASISADSSSTVNDSITFAGWFTSPIIHYMQKIGGGDIVYRIDGTNPTTITTAGTNSLIIIPTSTVSDGPHKISIKVSNAGTNGVVVCGVELNRNIPGIRVHNLGVAGSKLSEWVQSDSVTFKRSVATFSPNMIIISLGLNDCRNNVKPDVAIGNLKRIVNRCKDTLPNVPICIFSQGDPCDTPLNWPMYYYISQMRTYALDNNLSFVDNYSLIGPCSTGSLNGVYQDNQHLNAIGGDILKNNFLNYLVPFDVSGSDGFALHCYHNITGPFNNITYYFADTFNGIATSSGVVGKIYVPWNCKIVGYSAFTYVAGTLGSTENQSYYVRINNTKDITLSTIDKVNVLSNYSHSILPWANLNANDYFEIKGVTPTMVTAPTSVSRHFIIYLKMK